MNADKEFVLAHWGNGFDENYTDDHQFFFIADIGVNFDSWSSAAEFTRSRLEEIRQLERDIDRIENCFWSASNWQDNLDDLEEQGQVVDAVRQQCADVRIVSRLQAALAELKRGMK
jgi:hypothetical protein